MTPQLSARVQKIASPNVVELALKRRAKFGRLNVEPAFDLVAQISASEQRGDIRRRFALIVSRKETGQRTRAAISEGVGT